MTSVTIDVIGNRENAFLFNANSEHLFGRPCLKESSSDIYGNGNLLTNSSEQDQTMV